MITKKWFRTPVVLGGLVSGLQTIAALTSPLRDWPHRYAALGLLVLAAFVAAGVLSEPPNAKNGARAGVTVATVIFLVRAVNTFASASSESALEHELTGLFLAAAMLCAVGAGGGVAGAWLRRTTVATPTT